MPAAITRAVSPSMNRCELTFLDRAPIDLALAAEQHAAYEALLERLGARVISLPAEPDFPDSVFVEDPAIVLGEVAVITRPGAASRRGESEGLARALAPFRRLLRIEPPATLDGGDVVIAGKRILVGASARTNAAGIAQLREHLAPLGYSVDAVAVHGCLHLKSACCSLGDDALLVNRAWIDPAPLAAYRLIDVREPWAADVLPIGGSVVMPGAFPQTAELLREQGYKVCTLDISEIMKAEGGVTCMSLVFNEL